MENTSPVIARDMFELRNAAEIEIAGLIGKFVFQYSKFITGLHLCVAWHDDGKNLEKYGEIAQDLGAADLLKLIEKRLREKYKTHSPEFKKYINWLNRAHKLRELRNTIMHSRWAIEAYGQHAIAIPTPIFVEPIKEIIFTAVQLREASQSCERLTTELYKLREMHQL